MKHPASTSPRKRKPKPLNDSPARWKQIEKKYGLSKEDYYKILQDQAGACYLCLRTPAEIRRKQHLAVDHDHTTGEIRGLLCYNCNHRILPYIKEDAAYARRLVKYLTRKRNYGKVPN